MTPGLWLLPWWPVKRAVAYVAGTAMGACTFVAQCMRARRVRS